MTTVTVSSTVSGKRIITTLGMVQGNTVRARNVGADLLAGFKGIVGGELASYTKLMEAARTEAVGRMVSDAERRGANAVTDVRFTTSSIMGGAAEIMAYGTAVVIEPE